MTADPEPVTGVPVDESGTGPATEPQGPETRGPEAWRPETRQPGRRELVLAVLACTAGAALLLYAASRTWATEVAARPAPLRPVRTEHTGAGLVPALPALGLVALAGAGALVATRRYGRLLVGLALVLLGVAAAAGSGYGLTRLDRYAEHGGPAWPLLALVGGLVVVAAGLLAVVRGRDWPTMGGRYERAGTRSKAPAGASGPDDAAGTWDALDRGEDPTVGN